MIRRVHEKTKKVLAHLLERGYILLTMLLFVATTGRWPGDNGPRVEPRVCAQRKIEPHGTRDLPSGIGLLLGYNHSAV
jgi:hypothetical protein